MRNLPETIVALIAFITAVGSAYVAIYTRPTIAQVEHIVSYKTEDKFAELLRRMDKFDRGLERLIDKLDKKQ